MDSLSPIRLGISRCLLGEPVRYDGGHKRDAYLADILSQHVEWVPICPEVEAGLGTPREPMQLIGSAGRPKLVAVTTRQDKTLMVKRLSIRRLRELESLDLCGYVFKARSPSCGVDTVSIYDRYGRAITTQGTGVFAHCFQRHFPLIPIADEGQLENLAARDHFLARVFGYHRWQTFLRGTVTRHTIGLFHSAETTLLQKHSPAHFLTLSRLLSQASPFRSRQLANRYGTIYMSALALPPSSGNTRTTPQCRQTRHSHEADLL